jgi:hypothetical protein
MCGPSVEKIKWRAAAVWSDFGVTSEICEISNPSRVEMKNYYE